MRTVKKKSLGYPKDFEFGLLSGEGEVRYHTGQEQPNTNNQQEKSKRRHEPTTSGGEDTDSSEKERRIRAEHRHDWRECGREHLTEIHGNRFG